MEIMFIFPTSLRTFGGVSNWAKEILPRLHEKEIDIRVFASSFTDFSPNLTNETIETLSKEGIFYKELPIIETLKKFYIVPFKGNSLLKIKTFAKKADVVYTQNIFLGQDVQLLKIKKDIERPFIIGYHTHIYNGKILHDLITKLWLLRRWKSFSAHHVLTLEQQKFLLSHGYKNVRCIPNGVNTRQYLPGKMSEKNENYAVLFIGKLCNLKGVDIILECAKDIYKKYGNEIKFVFAGDGPLKNKVIEYSKRYSNIEYKGFVYGKNKLELYKTAHTFVLPSKAEGLPLVILEAMASGLYVISSSDYGIIPSGNIVDDKIKTKKYYLYQAIIKSYSLWESSEFKFNKICKNNRTVAEEFDWDNIVKKFVSFLKEVSLWY
ncbi:glycosyltransferase family 4 protein [Methanotorris formicicus]|uniref:Glycosyl transferase group 1 n=1 Tax=Methanotorris formicicus Mc-S-70 TaxID=647171 RepID=H1KX89_9EURY|nr:glycosyltransferase family 4 protein [Methanotorris formicicus]EHP88520.1 glycosyl transferase group 1 [Methanotorris formicicus Mc-S-70]